MAKKKVTRKELLKETDEFLTFSARAAIYVREHSRHFQYAGMFIAALIVIYLGITVYMNHINKKGQEAYNTAYYTLLKTLASDADQRDLKKPEGLFQEVLEEYGLSKVSPLASPELAYLRFLEKDYEGAISLYEIYLGKVPEEGPYHTMARLALATCYEQKGDLEKAIVTLKGIISVPEEFFEEQALLSLARVYRLANQPEKSRETLKTFLEKFKDSPFSPLAKAHLDRYRS
jgi:outer membrane protein assembly factor BamD (BamD/ComL family)